MLNKALSLAILFTLTSTLSPYHTHAQNHNLKIDDSNPALMQVYIDDMSTPFTNFKIYSKTTTGDSQYRDFLAEGNSIIGGNEKDAITSSLTYIKELLGQPAVTPTINLKLLDSVSGIASADSATIANGTTSLGEYFKNANANNEHISLNGQQGTINISCLSPQWYAGAYESIPHNGPYNFLSATFTHEIMHALGVYASTYAADDKFYLGETVYTNNQGDTALIINNFTQHLYDIYGTQAQVGMEIVPITIEEYKANAVQREPNKFYVFDRYLTSDSYQNLQYTSNSGISFRGDNVNAALTIDGTLRSVPAINWADNCPVPPVYGVPLNGFELNVDDNGKIYAFTEMAHLELQNSLLSHQLFRNWSTLMEAEIAVLQDLGYDIDRKRFFGSSIYASDLNNFINNKPYYARSNNAWLEGTASTQDWGVGLHVYGSNNKLTQTAPLLADGDYANGIRLEGQFNDLTINTKITANGKDGNGLLVSYGKKHNVTLNQNASIIADEDGAVGARFDFGDNMLGQSGYYMEARGSYYRLLVADPSNRILETYPSLQGELVTNFNVNGHLEGKAAAIYISHNALVKNININAGATIKGDIISEWNPHTIPIDKISRGEYTKLIDYRTGEPISWDLELPEGENGLTHLNFGYQPNEDGINQRDYNYNKNLDSNIIGKDSLVIDVLAGKLTTTGTTVVNQVQLAEHGLEANQLTQYTNKGDLTLASNLVVNGTFINENKLQTSFDEEGNSLSISGSDEGKIYLTGQSNPKAQFVLNAEEGLYNNETKIALVNTIVGTPTIEINNDNIVVNSNSATLRMTATVDPDTKDIIVTTIRDYTPFAGTEAEAQLAKQLPAKAAALAAQDQENLSALDQKWQSLIMGMDYNDSTGATAQQALHALNPHVYSSSAQATLNTHSTLNNLHMLGCFGNNSPVARTIGGRGPIPNISSQYNAWHNIVVPFSSYTDQHNGISSYTNHNNGVLGAMERTLDNGLTHGYHLAINHQSTSSDAQLIKGEGFYIGTQAKYAPAVWNGWQAFGSARLGLENMRSHRNLAIAGGSMGTADADWTGFSGSFSIGAALNKEHGVVKSGPFAALGYSFAHRPGVDEHGSGIPAHFASATYDSLKTQLGYGLATKPQALDSLGTQWQAHASIAWNHELLSDNGSTNYALEGLAKTITDKTADYGRDSMSVAAGILFKTPNLLDIGLTLGSDIYRKGGSSIYGKVNFEWKF